VPDDRELPDPVTMPRDAALALRHLFEVMYERVGFYDPGQDLVSDGTRLQEIGGLVEIADGMLIDEALEAVLPHLPAIRRALQPTSEPTTCRYCGRTSHGFVCWEMLQQEGRRQP
jgi:hypothetical protein